jgi:tRNA (guanosine-2'-O-)-methyltransferase
MRQIRSKTKIRGLMRESQRTHSPQVELAFLLQDWDDPYNVGGLFRIADACGAKEIILTGRTPQPPHPQIHVTSMGRHRNVRWSHVQAHEEAALKMIERGYTLIAVEIATDAIAYTDFEFPARTCLVLGTEGGGVYQSVLKHCAAAVFIPMSGKGRSLNVHVSGAVVAFQALYGLPHHPDANA